MLFIGKYKDLNRLHFGVKLSAIENGADLAS